jgi:hypothetical protein
VAGPQYSVQRSCKGWASCLPAHADCVRCQLAAGQCTAEMCAELHTCTMPSALLLCVCVGGGGGGNRWVLKWRALSCCWWTQNQVALLCGVLVGDSTQESYYCRQVHWRCMCPCCAYSQTRKDLSRGNVISAIPDECRQWAAAQEWFGRQAPAAGVSDRSWCQVPCKYQHCLCSPCMQSLANDTRVCEKQPSTAYVDRNTCAALVVALRA